MAQYKYYLARSGVGKPHEVYRGDPVYEVFSSSNVQRAKKDGAWSDANEELKWVMTLWRGGDFDPEDDEITEAQALAYLDEWRAGTWPGRE